MNLTPLNQAIDEAFNAALASPERVAEHEIAANVTLRTETYIAPEGEGFRVVCCVKIPEINFSVSRVRNHGPDIQSEIEWPEEGVEAAAEAHVASCISSGANFVLQAGFDADRKVILLNKLLKVKENFNLANYPKLIAVYEWMEQVQTMAVAGNNFFPSAPFTFEEVIRE